MSDKQVVLAIFESEAKADAAVQSLKDWDKADDDIKLNAIGVMVLDDKGKVKTHKLGKRSVGKGAGIGVILAIIAPPSLLAGVIGGGVLERSTTRAWASRPTSASGSRPSWPTGKRPSAFSLLQSTPGRSRQSSPS